MSRDWTSRATAGQRFQPVFEFAYSLRPFLPSRIDMLLIGTKGLIEDLGRLTGILLHQFLLQLFNLRSLRLGSLARLIGLPGSRNPNCAEEKAQQ